MKNTEPNILGFLAILAFFGIVGITFATPFDVPVAQTQPATAIEAVAQLPSSLRDSPKITANAAYAYDVTTHSVVFSHNESAQLPLASLTKIALILLAHEYLSPQGVVPITERSLVPEGDWGLIVGDTWNTQDLIDYTLMVSSNDGAAAIAEAIENATGSDIVTLLNGLASARGLKQTYFLNETGLDVNELFSGSYGSAHDVSILLAYAYEHAPQTFEATRRSIATFTSSSGHIYTANNTNKAIGDLPGLVIGKTGFTDLAGGNLGIVAEQEPGHPIVIVVLGSSITERFTDVASILAAVHAERAAILQK